MFLQGFLIFLIYPVFKPILTGLSKKWRNSTKIKRVGLEIFELNTEISNLSWLK